MANGRISGKISIRYNPSKNIIIEVGKKGGKEAIFTVFGETTNIILEKGEGGGISII